MDRNILIINGHPDGGKPHFCDALAHAYAEAARSAGYTVNMVKVADLHFPVIGSREEWERDTPPADIIRAQEAVTAADHVVLIYPLWLGTMPALLKAFLEQLLRPGFATEALSNGLFRKLLKGKSARIVVTMGMPATAYRWFFFSHSLRNLKRNILSFVGFHPVRVMLAGMVEGSAAHREKLLRKMRNLGARAA